VKQAAKQRVLGLLDLKDEDAAIYQRGLGNFSNSVAMYTNIFRFSEQGFFGLPFFGF
jgi:hypothetical protein